MSEKMCRSFSGVLYPDSESYNCDDVLAIIRRIFDSWGYILHDCDKLDDGSLKKPHYHWVGQQYNPTRLSTLSKKLGVPENSIEYIKKWRASVRYLFHLDNPNKFLYSFDKATITDDLKICFINKVDEESGVNEILHFIDESGCSSIGTLMRWCASNGYWSILRRSQSLFVAYMRERSQSIKVTFEERSINNGI